MTSKPSYGELEQKIKKLERELIDHKQRSALFECIFRAIPDAAVFVDSDRRIIMSNPALSRVFGYEEQEIRGRETEIFYSSKEDYEQQGEKRFNLSAEEKLEPYEVIYCKKNGETFPSETVGTRVRDDEGNILGFLGIMRDISKRQKAEDALRKASCQLEQRVTKRTNELKKERDKAQKYLDIASVIIVVLDKKGNVSLVNRMGAEILGCTEKEIVGENWFDNFIPEHEKTKVKRSFSRLVAGDISPPKYYENTIVTNDGQERLISWHNTVLRNKHGKIINTLSSGNDITDRKRAEIALLESSQKIKRFAYSVSHDLKSPAISLHGLTRHLVNQYKEIIDEKGKRFCRQLLSISEQILLLVENVNRYITTKELPFIFENVDLKEVCDVIKDEFSSRLRGREINLSASEISQTITADRLSILRVLRNFIDNAIKYGGESLSEIEIAYQDNGESHILSIRDNGSGFREEENEKMFEAFSRNTTSGDVVGTGLGLAIAKEIAEKHGGNAWAESITGQGAIFYISIAKQLK